MTAPTRAYVALGSNLGDRLGNLAGALAALAEAPGVRVLAVSSAYESEPWGGVKQPRFANAVAALEAEGDALTLLRECKRIERSLGREPGARYGPRTIDIDVLLFGSETIDTPELVVPHLRMFERDFVITPLLEIAPGALRPDGRPIDRREAVEGRVTGVLGAIPHLPGRSR